MKAETEIWQVTTHEGVFETDLPTLKQWVVEGLVRPTDKVRKGALKWIEAERAPSLRRVFSGEEKAEAVEHSQASNADGEWSEPVLSGTPALSSSCYFHPVAAATLVCRACSTTFCRSCPNKVGASSVLLCTLCGGFCDPLELLTERLALYERQGSGFGLADFGEALSYPFRHVASLLGGAVLYGFLLLAGMRAQLLAYAFVFGCISLVVRRVAYGNLERDFMPDFSEFSFWDDVIVPCSLGLGVTLVTLGPTLVLIVALLFGWFGGAQTASPLALVPHADSEQAERPGVTREEMTTLVKGGTAGQEVELEKKIQEMRPGAQVARGLAQSKEGEATGVTVVRQLLARPGLILLLGLVALGWAVFYHPMALLVAGWTESLKSVINPLVGLDTMRHMGLTYFKAFLMYLAVQTVALLLSFLVGLATAPFDMPFVGNLPAKFLSGIVTFYTSLVIACLLGLALFKSADRLGIELD
ncbi:MAG: hypothetical protein QOE46_3300 [Acidobacteriota bacterium]|jgi:hypothetical protein|nr:hypothetical protein [Acidobacteriota bacterium]